MGYDRYISNFCFFSIWCSLICIASALYYLFLVRNERYQTATITAIKSKIDAGNTVHAELHGSKLSIEFDQHDITCLKVGDDIKVVKNILVMRSPRLVLGTAFRIILSEVLFYLAVITICSIVLLVKYSNGTLKIF